LLSFCRVFQVANALRLSNLPPATWLAMLLAANTQGIMHAADAHARWRPAQTVTGGPDGLAVRKAAFPDGVDTRRVIDGAVAPFVAQIGVRTRNQGWLTYANGFQVLNNRILAMPLHVVFADGKIITSQGTANSARGSALFIEVRFRSCGEQVYRVENVVDHGNIANRADSGNDWLVGILDRPTCIDKNRIPAVLPLKREIEEKYLLPREGLVPDGRQLEARQYAETPSRDLNNSRLIARNGRKPDRRQGSWLAKESRLTVASGFIAGEAYYRVVDKSHGAGAIEWINRSEWIPDKAGNGRLYETRIPHTKGNSGAPVLASGTIELNGRTVKVEGVVGMVVSDVVGDKSAFNYLMPLRNRFFEALIRAHLGVLADRY